MKLIYFAFFLCFSLPSYSQEYGSDFPKATVTSIITAQTTTYSFKSNYLIEEYKAPMLQERLLNRYPELIEINISYSTQIISFKILSENSELFLEKFVAHFKYSGYEIN
jgi:hypothetical protein